jgi:hypothetical protein
MLQLENYIHSDQNMPELQENFTDATYLLNARAVSFYSD